MCFFSISSSIVPLTITATPHEKALTAGETFVQLQCHASGGQVSLTWSKLNSAPLSANPGKFLAVGDGLIVTGVDKDTDNGVYVCNGTDGKQHASDKVIGKNHYSKYCSYLRRK